MQQLFLSQWLPDALLKALSWTLLHSLWQGLIAALLAAIILGFTKRSAAQLRYQLLGAVLFFFVIAASITFYRQLNPASSESSATISTAQSSNVSVISQRDSVYFTEKSFTSEMADWFNSHADLVVLGWAFLFFFNCLRLSAGLASVRRLRYYKTHPVSAEWKEKLDQLCRALHIRESVGLMQSELVKVPVAIGFLKPVILIPVGLIAHLSPQQVETILLHELAHIRRKDYFINLLQRFTEAMFFFNPALLWVSSLIREEREACCDDIVVAHTEYQRSYLDALVAFQEYTFVNRGYAMQINGKSYHLLDRVRRIITQENRNLRIKEKLALLAGVILLMAFQVISKRDTENSNAITLAEAAHTATPNVVSASEQTQVQPLFKPSVKKEKNIHNTLTGKKLPVRKDSGSVTTSGIEPVSKLKKELPENLRVIGVLRENLKQPKPGLIFKVRTKNNEQTGTGFRKSLVDSEKQRAKIEAQLEQSGISKTSEIKRRQSMLFQKKVDSINHAIQQLNASISNHKLFETRVDKSDEASVQYETGDNDMRFDVKPKPRHSLFSPKKNPPPSDSPRSPEPSKPRQMNKKTVRL